MEQKGNIVREYGENYTCIPSDILHDNRVGCKARGLYATIFGLPKDWDLSVQGLVAILKEGERAIYAALNELETSGYVTRSQSHTGTGFGKVMYTVHVHSDSYVLRQNVHTQNVHAQNEVQYSNTSNKEHKNVNTVETPKRQSKALSLDFDMADGYRELMTVWTDYKRMIKHPYKTQTGLYQCYKKLYSLSNGNPQIAEEIINQSIAFEWQGLFELKNHVKGTNIWNISRDEQRRQERDSRMQGYAVVANAMLEGAGKIQDPTEID